MLFSKVYWAYHYFNCGREKTKTIDCGWTVQLRLTVASFRVSIKILIDKNNYNSKISITRLHLIYVYLFIL